MHGLVEATKRAFLVRDRVITDPDRIDGNLSHFLSAEFLDSEAGKIDARKAAPWPDPQARGDTIWMGAADASGLVVSFIQSLYWESVSYTHLERSWVCGAALTCRTAPGTPGWCQMW